MHIFMLWTYLFNGIIAQIPEPSYFVLFIGTIFRIQRSIYFIELELYVSGSIKVWLFILFPSMSRSCENFRNLDKRRHLGTFLSPAPFMHPPDLPVSCTGDSWLDCYRSNMADVGEGERTIFSGSTLFKNVYCLFLFY